MSIETEMDNEALVASFVKLRDRKKEIAAQHKEELKPLDEMLGKLEGVLADRLAAAGATSIKTGGGTFYKSVKDRVKVVDWPAALDWILENGRHDFLTRSVAKEPYMEVIEAGEQVPGLLVDQFTTVNVRRS